jgi:hypothetical protein
MFTFQNVKISIFYFFNCSPCARTNIFKLDASLFILDNRLSSDDVLSDDVLAIRTNSELSSSSSESSDSIQSAGDVDFKFSGSVDIPTNFANLLNKIGNKIKINSILKFLI